MSASSLLLIVSCIFNLWFNPLIAFIRSPISSFHSYLISSESFPGRSFFIFPVTSLIGRIVFLVNINIPQIIKRIENMFVNTIDLESFLKNSYSEDSLFFRLQRTFSNSRYVLFKLISIFAKISKLN